MHTRLTLKASNKPRINYGCEIVEGILKNRRLLVVNRQFSGVP